MKKFHICSPRPSPGSRKGKRRYSTWRCLVAVLVIVQTGLAAIVLISWQSELERVQSRQQNDMLKVNESERMEEGQDPTDDPEVKADPVRLVVLVKTGAGYSKRRVYARSNWFNVCSIGRLNALAQYANITKFDYIQAQRRLGAEYYRVAGHRFQHDGIDLAVSCMFVIGILNKNAKDQRLLHSEMRNYGDLLLPGISDSYQLMGSKTIWMAAWSLITLFYDYVLLMDDDTTVVWANLAPLVLHSPRSGVYAGHLHPLREVIRCEDLAGMPDKAKQELLAKNCVPLSEFEGSHYPPFASGFAYFFSRDVASKIILTALSMGFVPGNVEDAMIGVMAERANIKLTSFQEFIHWEMDSIDKLCRSDVLFAVVGNANQSVLNTLAYNANKGQTLCQNIVTL